MKKIAIAALILELFLRVMRKMGEGCVEAGSEK
jgi:hypothetical protein